MSDPKQPFGPRLVSADSMHDGPLRVAVVGYGYWGPNLTRNVIERPELELAALCERDPARAAAFEQRVPGVPVVSDLDRVLEDPTVDAVIVATPPRTHYPLVKESLEAGKHVLVEKPLATSLEEGFELVELSRHSRGLLVCAPHILLSPTFRAMHACARSGRIGDLLSARARYGWAGPWWNEWFYERGGGSLFDLGVYNVTTLCALFGSARRVTAMVGTAIAEREVNGRTMTVEADDNAHVLLDFGNARFGVVTTGFTMQKYRSPAVEIYGSEGTMQMLGDDWAPDGWELWRNEDAVWQVHPETDPHWQWTDGLRHLVDCIESGTPTTTRPEHALHALEIMLAAQAAGADGRARQIETIFPEPVFGDTLLATEEAHRSHDRRSHDGV